MTVKITADWTCNACGKKKTTKPTYGYVGSPTGWQSTTLDTFRVVRGRRRREVTKHYCRACVKRASAAVADVLRKTLGKKKKK